MADTPPHGRDQRQVGPGGRSISTLPVTAVRSHGASCWASTASALTPSAASARAAAMWFAAAANDSAVRSRSSRAAKSAPSRRAQARVSASPSSGKDCGGRLRTRAPARSHAACHSLIRR